MYAPIPGSGAGRLVAAVVVPLLVVDPAALPPAAVVGGRPAASQLRLDVGVLEHGDPGMGLGVDQSFFLFVVVVPEVVVQAAPAELHSHVLSGGGGGRVQWERTKGEIS
jgi:hypothetical protein